MKKFIFATIIALMALTSCRLDRGDVPNADKMPNMLYHKMYRSTLENCLPYFSLVVITEMLMAGDVTIEQINSQLLDDITVENGIYYFKPDIDHSAYVYAYPYVATDGRQIADGGEWKAGFISIKDSTDFGVPVTIKGNAEAACEFTMSFATRYEDEDWDGIINITQTEGTFASAYEVENQNNTITITNRVTTSAVYMYEGREGEYNNSIERYRIEWSSLEPMLIVNWKAKRLAMDIHYTHLDSGKTHHVAAYVNGDEKRFERFAE